MAQGAPQDDSCSRVAQVVETEEVIGNRGLELVLSMSRT